MLFSSEADTGKRETEAILKLRLISHPKHLSLLWAPTLTHHLSAYHSPNPLLASALVYLAMSEGFGQRSLKFSPRKNGYL